MIFSVEAEIEFECKQKVEVEICFELVKESPAKKVEIIMVFTTAINLVRSRGPDEFWRKRKIFKLAAVSGKIN
jgi:tryptophan synthase alpha subunit